MFSQKKIQIFQVKFAPIFGAKLVWKIFFLAFLNLGFGACSKVGNFFAEKCAADNPNCKDPGLEIISSGSKLRTESGELNNNEAAPTTAPNDVVINEPTTITFSITNSKLYPLLDFTATLTPATGTGYAIVASTDEDDCANKLNLYWGESCTVTVSYIYDGVTTPTASNITLNFKTPKGDAEVFNVPLELPVIAPDFTLSNVDTKYTVSVSPFNAGSVTAPLELIWSGGAGSYQGTLIVKNWGSSDIDTIATIITGSADFTVDATSTCVDGNTLAAGATCTTVLNYKPTAAGTAAATTLNFTGSSGGTAVSHTYTLTGTANALTASVTSITIPVQEISAAAVPNTVVYSLAANADSTAASSCTFSVEDDADGVFSVSDPGAGACTNSIGAATSCSKTLTYTPSAAPGTHSGNLVVDCDDRGGSISIALSGRTAITADLATDLPVGADKTVPIDLGNILLGTTAGDAAASVDLTISNIGTEASITGFTRTMSASSTPANGTFSVFSDACGTSLTQSTSCVTNLTYVPTTTGANTAILTIAGTRVNAATDRTITRNFTATGIKVTPSQASWDAGTTIVNTTSSSSPQVITITNPSTTQSTSGCALTLADTTNYSLSSDTCTGNTSLTAGGTCSFSLSFAPTTTGTKNSSVSYACTVGGTATVTLTGISIDDERLVPLTNAVDLGVRLLGIVDDTSVFTFENQDTSGQSVTNVVASANNSQTPSPWSVLSNTCTTVTLANSQSCTLTMRYAPSAAPGSTDGGTMNGSVGITSTQVNPGDPTYTAVGKTLESTTSSIDFGNVYQTQTLLSNLVTVTNPSSIDAATSCYVDETGDASYTITNNTCGTVGTPVGVAASGSCSFKVSLTANTTLGAIPASSARVTCTVGGQLVIPITGTVIAGPLITISDSDPYDFGNVDTNTTGTHDFTVTNTSLTTAGTSMTYTVSSAGSTYFSKSSTTCTGTLAANSSCTVTVAYAPTTAEGTKSATLTAAAGGEFVSTARTMIAKGTSMSLALDLSSWTYSDREVGQAGTETKTFTLTNNGNRTANISASFISNTNSVFANTGTGTCGSTLAATASCTYVLSFTAHTSASAGDTGTFRIVENGAAVSINKDISLTGTTVGTPLLQIIDDHGNTTYGNTITLTDITGATDASNNIVGLLPPTATATFTVKNVGTGATTPGVIFGASPATLTNTSGTNGTMAVTTNNCASTTLALNGTCTIIVTYSPTTTNQNSKYSLSVAGTSATSGSSYSTSVTEIRGTSITPASIGVTSGSPTDFGLVALSTTNTSSDIAMTNSGIHSGTSMTYTITTNPSSVYSKVNGSATNCGTSLAGSASCNVKAQFAPGTAIGAFSGVLSIAGNGAGTNGTGAFTTQTVALKGATVSYADIYTGNAEENTNGYEGDVTFDSTRFYITGKKKNAGGYYLPSITVCSRTSTGALDTSACSYVNLGTLLGSSATKNFAGDTSGSGPRVAVQGNIILIAIQNMDDTKGGETTAGGGTSTVVLCDKPGVGSNVVSSCTYKVVNSTVSSGRYPGISTTSSKVFITNTLLAAGTTSLVLSICDLDSSSAVNASTISGCQNNSIVSMGTGNFNGLYVDTGGNRVLMTTEDLQAAADGKLRLSVCTYSSVATTNTTSSCTSSNAGVGFDASGIVDSTAGQNWGIASSVYLDGTHVYITNTNGTVGAATDATHLVDCSLGAGTNIRGACSSVTVASGTAIGFNPGLAVGTAKIWVTTSTRTANPLGSVNDKFSLQIYQCTKSPVSCTATAYYDSTAGIAFHTLSSRISTVFDSTNFNLYIFYRSLTQGDSTARNGILQMGLDPEL